ncbi:MAG: class I SAM-dependent methyltransferase [Melioribacteraceae bacterium]|nr:class I SAM-dependent methyltransferase [Melioribacteraceae bacterium]MCF8353245.1 class I SAM-dependent methyltransferase [Melioribacteraceae bacterium]MCF8393977.1 class I SAM-dependent methyltransferase [Melioribacteraceae bacterium]MCF8418721.1 class I SAM-dependent methyltransferase [Melioribacteraceae bacterium]
MTSKRWELAQSYEKNWWANRKDIVDFSFYKKFADDLKAEIKEHLEINSGTSILEIGSGAGGIITFLNESKDRHAVDPLEDFYSSIEDFTKQRNEEVEYIRGVGEKLPYTDHRFDLIIMDNVLDHCDDIESVMSEVRRVLNRNGIVYFKQNVYTKWGRFIRQLMEKFTIDKGHPHTFTVKSLVNLFSENSFQSVFVNESGYFSTWKKEISSFAIKDLIKALLLVTRNKLTYILK